MLGASVCPPSCCRQASLPLLFETRFAIGRVDASFARLKQNHGHIDWNQDGTFLVVQKGVPVVKDHQTARLFGIVLSWHINPVRMLCALEDLTRHYVGPADLTMRNPLLKQ